MRLIDCGLKTFFKRAEEKVIFCVGAGKVAEEAMHTIQISSLKNNKVYFADNFIFGKKKKIANKVYKILSIKEMLERITKNSVVLITINAVEEVYMQLSGLISSIQVECYIYSFLLAYDQDQRVMSVEFNNSFRRSKEELIPKILHYCWFGDKAIPKKNLQWMKSWEKFCPDYKIIEWNERNYDVSKNRYMFEAYKAKKWAFVPDYARLDIIYQHGGIYLDTDIELVKNLDEFLYQEAFCGFENEKAIAFGLGFGAKKHFNILKEIMNDYRDLSFKNLDGSLNLTASPFYLTNVMRRFGLKLNGKYQIVKEMAVYPEKVLCGKNFHTGNYRITKDTYAIHHYDASWFSKEKYIAVQERRKLAKLAERSNN